MFPKPLTPLGEGAGADPGTLGEGQTLVLWGRRGADPNTLDYNLTTCRYIGT